MVTEIATFFVGLFAENQEPTFDSLTWRGHGLTLDPKVGVAYSTSRNAAFS